MGWYDDHEQGDALFIMLLFFVFALIGAIGVILTT